MRYAVIGSRTFQNYDILYHVLEKHYITQIVSGGAIGADSLGARYALEKGIPLLEFLPDWKRNPNTAGFIRNKKIIQNCDVVLTFWNGFSSGTRDSIEYAKKLGKKVIVISI